MDRTLTIIPAKLGSERLPKKNVLMLCGKPLVQYTIEAALKSGVCGEVMVSTESEIVADIARSAGAKIPFLRPEHLGRDPYGVVDVCMHVLKEYERNDLAFERLIVLLPTCPFRSSEDIVEADRLFTNYKAKFLMSVSEFSENPYGALMEDSKLDGTMVPCFPQGIGKKRHELPRTYRCNGAVSIFDVPAYREAGTDYGTPLFTYIMPWQRSVDIDTEMDFRFAEFLVQQGMV